MSVFSKDLREAAEVGASTNVVGNYELHDLVQLEYVFMFSYSKPNLKLSTVFRLLALSSKRNAILSVFSIRMGKYGLYNHIRLPWVGIRVGPLRQMLRAMNCVLKITSRKWTAKYNLSLFRPISHRSNIILRVGKDKCYTFTSHFLLSFTIGNSMKTAVSLLHALVR
jgi:hypothetical protein